MKLLTAAIAVCVFALSACQGSSASGQAEPSPATVAPSSAAIAPSPTPLPAVLVSPTPSPTPATLTVEQAAASYKAIAKTYNKQLKRLQKKYATATSLAANRKFYGKLAEYEKAFLKKLKAIVFPADIQPDADRLIKAIVVLRRAELSAARAKTWSEMATAAKAAANRNLKAADLAAILRDDLGLPSNN